MAIQDLVRHGRSILAEKTVDGFELCSVVVVQFNTDWQNSLDTTVYHSPVFTPFDGAYTFEDAGQNYSELAVVPAGQVRVKLESETIVDTVDVPVGKTLLIVPKAVRNTSIQALKISRKAWREVGVWKYAII